MTQCRPAIMNRTGSQDRTIVPGQLKLFQPFVDMKPSLYSGRWHRWFLVVGTNKHGAPVNLWLDPPKPGYGVGFGTGYVAVYRILAEAEEWLEPEDQGG